MQETPRKSSLWKLLLLVVIIAIPVGWCLMKMNAHAEEQEVLSNLKSSHEGLTTRLAYSGPGWIPREYQPEFLNRAFSLTIVSNGNNGGDSNASAPPFGDAEFASMLESLQKLHYLQEMQLPSSDITDASIEYFKTLRKLYYVNAAGSQIQSNQVVTRETGPDIKIQVEVPGNAERLSASDQTNP